MSKTRPSSKVVRPVKRFAAGLHYPDKQRTYLFEDFMSGAAPKQRIMIGRGRDCDIRIDNGFVSERHAVLEREDDAMYLVDHFSTNGVYIDSVRVEGAVALTEGLHIKIGPVLLIATDAEGKFYIEAKTISDMCRQAAPLYGNDTLAGEQLGRSRTFIARQRVPRALRYKTQPMSKRKK